MTLDDFLNIAAEMDLDGVELTSYYFPPEPEISYLNRLKRRAFLLGLDVSGGAVRDTITFPPGPERDQNTAHIKKWLRHCAELGAPCMRVFAGGAPKGFTEEQAMKHVVECLEECAPEAERQGVIIALENHGGVTATADQIVSMVKAVKSDWVGINLDTGNFATEDPYADIAKAAPYAVTTHVKVQVRPKGQPAEPVDLVKVRAILDKVGYRGYLSLEYEDSEDPMTGVPKFISKLKDTIG